MDQNAGLDIQMYMYGMRLAHIRTARTCERALFTNWMEAKAKTYFDQGNNV